MVTEMKDIFPNQFNGSTLPIDATAQFAAGILYGESQNTKDDRVYLVGCTSHHENLDIMLKGQGRPPEVPRRHGDNDGENFGAAGDAAAEHRPPRKADPGGQHAPLLETGCGSHQGSGMGFN